MTKIKEADGFVVGLVHKLRGTVPETNPPAGLTGDSPAPVKTYDLVLAHRGVRQAYHDRIARAAVEVEYRAKADAAAKAAAAAQRSAYRLTNIANHALNTVAPCLGRQMLVWPDVNGTIDTGSIALYHVDVVDCAAAMITAARVRTQAASASARVLKYLIINITADPDKAVSHLYAAAGYARKLKLETLARTLRNRASSAHARKKAYKYFGRSVIAL